MAPLPVEGPSGLAVAPEHYSQLLLSPDSDNSLPHPNLAPPDNPLRLLLEPEERECHLWAGRGWAGLGYGGGSGPHSHPFYLSPFMLMLLRVGVRGDCLLPRPPGLPANSVLPWGPAAGGPRSWGPDPAWATNNPARPWDVPDRQGSEGLRETCAEWPEGRGTGSVAGRAVSLDPAPGTLPCILGRG